MNSGRASDCSPPLSAGLPALTHRIYAVWQSKCNAAGVVVGGLTLLYVSLYVCTICLLCIRCICVI